MQKILVNASGAKLGGALTILNSFCASNVDDTNFYYILSPTKPVVMPLNSRWLKLKTSGISTLLFTILFSAFYYFYYSCDKIISFSNVNNVFPLKGRVTYFHNVLICNDSSLKYKIFRFALRFLNQRSVKFIFQTEYVKNRFISDVFFTEQYKICWPGFDLKHSVFLQKDLQKYKNESFLLVPITNVLDEHKNFELVVSLALRLQGICDVKFLVTAHKGSWEGVVPNNIHFIDNLSHDKFLYLMSISSGTVITSTYETICLPIFESISLGKPSFVFDADYLEGLFSLFGKISGLHVFKSEDDFYYQLKNSNKFGCKLNSTQLFHIGDWEFYE